MKKVYKTTAALVILSCLLMMGSFTALGAAVPTAASVTPGRTILNVQTGVITPNSVTIPHYAASTTLNGTVVIDGPKLVLKVNGVDVTAAASVVKVSDKTWTYSYTYQFNQAVGDISINLEAYTIYVNGKTAGNIHTQAVPVSQKIHVPYVKSFEYTNLTWDSYDRVTNIFNLSYNLVKVWDDGARVTDAQKTTGTVEGTAVYTLTASDPTHNGGASDAFGTITPPVVFRNFTYPASSAGYTWAYDKASKTFGVSFAVTKLWSNGNTAAETFTVNGLAPGAQSTITLTIEDVPNSTVVTAPSVKSFEYTNLTWDSYDRATNTFSFSYNLIRVWDDGERVTDDQKTTGTVEGTAVYTLMASDPTHNGGAPDAFGTIIPPVVFRNFSYPASSAEYTWTYDAASKTYSVSFAVTKLWSNGTTAAETFTVNGLAPGAQSTITLTIEGLTNSTVVTAPAAPAPPVITVTGTQAVYVSKEVIAANKEYNNYRVYYNLNVSLSDGSAYTLDNLSVTFPFNKANQELTRSFTKAFALGGKDYEVTFSLTIQ